MKTKQTEHLPPVEIHNYRQFLAYARQAMIVTFEPVYYVTPFEGEVVGEPAQWLRALRIYAIGVKLNGSMLTMMHRIDFSLSALDYEEGVFDCVAAESELAQIVHELETKYRAVPGAPDQPSLHDEWIRTLR